MFVRSQQHGSAVLSTSHSHVPRVFCCVVGVDSLCIVDSMIVDKKDGTTTELLLTNC